MNIFDDNGCKIDANYSLSAIGINKFIIVESRGGGGSGRKEVNKDYNLCIEILLKRLSMLKASILSIEVYSQVTKKFLESERVVVLDNHKYPLYLNELTDFKKIRLDVARKSSLIGKHENSKGGNRTKRLRFLVDMNASSILDNYELEKFLQFGITSNVDSKIDKIVFLRKLNIGCNAFYDGENKCVVFKKDSTSVEMNDDLSILLNYDEFDDLVGLTKLKFDCFDVLIPPVGEAVPKQTAVMVNRFKRCIEICAWALSNAKGVCEMCDLPAPFLRGNGEPFLEVHHVRPLSEGGPDLHDNVVALCPNCHRELHYSGHKDIVRLSMLQKVDRLRDYAAVPSEN